MQEAVLLSSDAGPRRGDGRVSGCSKCHSYYSALALPGGRATSQPAQATWTWAEDVWAILEVQVLCPAWETSPGNAQSLGT